MTLLNRRQTIAVRVESTPGTAEDVGSADAGFVTLEPSVSPNIEQIERQFFRDSLGSIPSLTGVREGTVSFSTELTGSGDHVASAPPWDAVIRGCGYVGTTGLHGISIGAITSGPFEISEQVTGGTSAATANVAISLYNGQTTLYLYNVSGTFQSGETITGGTSGASATSSSVATELGRMYRPVSTGFEPVTVGYLLGDDTTSNGLRVRMAGCLGNFTLSTSVGQQVLMQGEFLGGIEDPDDVTFFSATEPAQTPPQFFNAGLRLLDGFEADTNSADMSTGNQLAIRRSSKTTSGISGSTIINRQGSGSMDPLGVVSATHNFFQKWFDNDTGAITYNLGSSSGNRFVVHAPRAQYTGVAPTDRDGLTAFGTNLALHDHTANDHLVILCL